MVDRQTMSAKRSRLVHTPDEKAKLDMLHFMKLTREIEDRIERKLYRQGRIVGGVYVGRGQEAISVGTAIHMEKNDVVAPSHRDMGVFLMRGITPRRIIAQYMGRATGLTRRPVTSTISRWTSPSCLVAKRRVTRSAAGFGMGGSSMRLSEAGAATTSASVLRGGVMSTSQAPRPYVPATSLRVE